MIGGALFIRLLFYLLSRWAPSTFYLRLITLGAKGLLAKPFHMSDLAEHLDVAARLQELLELQVQVEVIFDRPLLAAGDDDDLLDAGRDRLLDGVLDDRFVNEREHLLGQGLGGR